MDMRALRGFFFQRKAKLTPGVDRVNAERFHAEIDAVLTNALKKIETDRFDFSPYLELLISKGRGKVPRIVARPTIRDKLILIAIKEVLHECLPAHIPKRLPNQVVREVICSILSHGECDIVRADIQSFYDHIRHDRLEKSLRRNVPHKKTADLLFKSIRGSVVPLFHRKSDVDACRVVRGVPQGLPISNFLANYYLSDVDVRMADNCLSFHRYVDDVVLVNSSGTGEKALDRFRLLLRPLGLKLNLEKTRVFSAQSSFEFLGYQINKGKAKPRQQSVEKYIRSIAALFSMLRQGKLPRRMTLEGWTDEQIANAFIDDLNEKITGAISGNRQYGWVFYFNESTDLTVFSQIDMIIKKMARQTDLLTNDMRRKIKSPLRAYHETRHSKTAGYIFNYDVITTISQKADFLWKRGYKNQNQIKRMSQENIEAEYERVLDARLMGLDRDVGVVS